MDHVMLTITVVTVIAVVLVFNTLIGRKNQVTFAFASIDAQLKKRYDLIPNLVSVCEKYMGYEQKILTDLTLTRVQASNSHARDRIGIDTQLSTQLRAVFAVAEKYPDLRAVDTFMHLQRSLSEVEEQLSAARRAYNAAVMLYNNACQMLPTSLAARALGYAPSAMFEASATEREPTRVWR
jgi:LemA protein